MYRNGHQWVFLQAVTLFSQLRQEGLQPNAITFTTLMKAYQRSGQLESAQDTFLAAQQDGHGNIVATNKFIDVLVDARELQLASQVRALFSRTVLGVLRRHTRRYPRRISSHPHMETVFFGCMNSYRYVCFWPRVHDVL